MAHSYHDNRARYFEHQYRVTADYVIPFVELSGGLPVGARVLEIGCAESGVLKAFLERGAVAVGVDRSKLRLDRGREFLAEEVRTGRLTLLNEDAQELARHPEYQGYFDLIVLKDVIEHVEDRPALFALMERLLRPGGRIFMAFPPWRMPFGGHQQICRNWLLSRTPYFHLLPTPAYRAVLGLFKEKPARIESLLATKRTGLASAEFEQLANRAGFEVLNERFYLLNPMYNYRFRLEPRVQSRWISARTSLRDLLTTCAYYTLRPAYAAVLACLVLACVLAAPPAAAQPAGLSSQAPASSGATQVAKEGFQAVAAPPAEESKDATTFKATVGGFLSAGNSRTIALTVAADYLLRRGPSEFSALAAINYGRSAPGPDLPSRTTVDNYQGRVRYDYFFSGALAGFTSVSARKDKFQGLDLRLNIDPGLAYYFIDEKDQRFWAELGYDLQYDLRRDDIVALSLADDTLPDLRDDDLSHSARLFAGYLNQVLPSVKFNAGLEYLQNVQDTEKARLNADLGLTAQLNGSFSVATTLAIKYDNAPLAAVESTDIVSALNLVYTMSQ